MKYSFIIVNWDGRAFLEECFASLEAQTFKDFDVYITDNGSVDGSVEYIREQFPHYKLILNDRNLGFAEANNQAIAKAIEAGSEFVVAFNNDARLAPDWLEQIDKAVESSPPETGMWQGLVVGHPEHRVIDSAGIEYFKNATASQIGVNLVNFGQHEDGEVYGINAAAGVYRTAMLSQITPGTDYLDRDFFAYFEDVELVVRARRFGWRARFVPAAVTRHIGSATSGKESPFKWRLTSRNRWLLLAKTIPFSTIIRMLPGTLWAETRLTLGFLLEGRPELSKASIGGRLQAFRYLPLILKKRKQINALLKKNRLPHAIEPLVLPVDRAHVSDKVNAGTVSVVIPTWNGKHLLGPCLDSLREQTYDKMEVLVVDNGSVDGTAEFVEKEYPEAIVIPQPFNRGFAGGVNAGIRSASGEYILLLNNDALAAPTWAEELVAFAKKHPEAAMVTSKILKLSESDPEQRIDTTGDFQTTWGTPYPRGREEVDQGQYDEPSQVFSACGGATLYRRDVLGHIGIFDNEFFAYYEDVDISYRARLAGYEIWYTPTAVVYHKIGATSGGGMTPFSRYHSVKNLWYLYLKNTPGWLFFKHLPKFILLQSVLFASSVKRGLVGAHLKAVLRAGLMTPFMLKKRRHIQKTRVLSLKQTEALLMDQLPPNIASLARKLSFAGRK